MFCSLVLQGTVRFVGIVLFVVQTVSFVVRCVRPCPCDRYLIIPTTKQPNRHCPKRASGERRIFILTPGRHTSAHERAVREDSHAARAARSRAAALHTPTAQVLPHAASLSNAMLRCTVELRHTAHHRAHLPHRAPLVQPCCMLTCGLHTVLTMVLLRWPT